MNKGIIVGLVAVLSLASCKTASTSKNTGNTSAATAPVSVNKTDAENSFFTAISKPASFKQLKISSKIDAQTGTFVPTADATTYIENSNKIWMNVSVAFLGIARGIANPQGLKGYEKIGRNYIDSDFTYLNRLLNVNFINYNALQNLLTGKTFLPIDRDGYIFTKTTDGYLLDTAAPKDITQNGVTRSYTAQLRYSPSFMLTQVSVQDTGSADGLQVYYSGWKEFGGENFPQNVKIVLKGTKQGQINIQNTKFKFLPMDTPYTVPANYTKKDIR